MTVVIDPSHGVREVIELSHNERLVVIGDGHALIMHRKSANQKTEAITKRRRKFDVKKWTARVEADWAYLEEKVWIPRVRRFFVDQGEVMAKRLSSRSRRMAKVLREGRDAASTAQADANAKAAQLVDEVWDDESFKQAFAEMVVGLEDDTVQMAFTALQNALGISFDQPPSEVTKDILTTRANQLAGHVADSTYKQVQRALRDGILKGESIPDLATRVTGAFTGASTRRATVIARTEVPSAYNGAVWSGGQSMPPDVAAGMMWITTHDARTRPAHRIAGGQIVKTGDTFHVGGEELRYPGDPNGRPGNIIQCRCATAIVVPEDMPEELRQWFDFDTRRGVVHTSQLLVRVAMGYLSYEDALRELRGEGPGHKFHGNQHDGGGALSGETVTVTSYSSPMKVPKEFVTGSGDDASVDFTAWQAHDKKVFDSSVSSLRDGQVSLTGDEARTLGVYQSAFGTYHGIQGEARAGKLDGEYGEHIRTMDGIVAKSHTPVDVTVHRGRQFKDAKEQKAFMSTLHEGAVIQDHGFSSTSLDSSHASQFAGNGTRPAINMKINVPKGTPYRYVDDREHEVLLARGAKMKVRSVTPGVSMSRHAVYDVEVDVIP